MVDTTLVAIDAPAGKKVLDALAADGIPVAVALWAKTSDYDEVRLFVASPAFDAGSKLDAHTRISRAVQPEFLWSAPNIVVLRMDDLFICALRDVFARTASVEGMRLGGQVWGNRYVEDAYVYVIR